MSWRFDSTDSVVCSIGSCNLTGAYTLALLFRRNSNTNYHSLLVTQTSGGTPAVSLEVESNGAGNNLESGKDDTTFTQSTGTFTTATWYLIVVTRDGASTMRDHYVTVNNNAGATMTHENMGATLAAAASQSGGTVNFSNYKSGSQDPLDGWLALAAVWNGTALDDTQSQALNANLKSSDWWNSSAGHPSGFWQPRGSTSSLSDLSGNGANSTSVTGVTDDSGTDPAGWTFDGIGGAAAPTPPAIVAPSIAVMGSYPRWP